MKISNLVSGVFLFAFSIFLWFWLIPDQIEEGFGNEISPRLLPQVCAVGIGLLSLILIASELRVRGKRVRDSSPVSASECVAFLSISGLLVLGIWLFSTVGALVATLVVVVGIMLAMGVRRPIPLVLLPGTLIAGAYLLFYQALGIAIV